MPFKKVNAVYKAFDILDLISGNNGPMGISEIATSIHLNKSTVYNIIHSLVDMAILNKTNDKFFFGPKLYLLGQIVDYESLLIKKIRPQLESFSEQTRLTISLGVRSDVKLILLERIHAPGGIDIFISKNKIRPMLEGAHGKAIMSLLPDTEIDEIFERIDLVKRTPKTVIDKKKFKENVNKVREDGYAIEHEEFLEGIWAVAVPFRVDYLHVEAVIWAFGLETKASNDDIRLYANKIKSMVQDIKKLLY